MSDKFDPIEPAFVEQMQALASFLDELFNPERKREVGFVLLSFRFGADPEQRANYISNAQLPDVIKMLETFLPHAKARQDADRKAALQ